MLGEDGAPAAGNKSGSERAVCAEQHELSRGSFDANTASPVRNGSDARLFVFHNTFYMAKTLLKRVGDRTAERCIDRHHDNPRHHLTLVTRRMALEVVRGTSCQDQ